LFLATASHELKTPLTVISGFASTLMRYKDLDDDTKSAALDAICTRSQELTRIVDRLLLSSRIEAGRLELNLGEVDVARILRERTGACAAAMGRIINCTVPDVMPGARGNTDALCTIVDHLLDNGIKYSPGRQPIEVHAFND